MGLEFETLALTMDFVVSQAWRSLHLYSSNFITVPQLDTSIGFVFNKQ